MARYLFALVCLAAVILLPACASDPATRSGVWRNPRDRMIFVRVPAGSLRVQAPAEPPDPQDLGKTIRQEVTFAEGFWLGRTEVTVGQFRRFAEQTGYISDAERASHRFTWRRPGFPQKESHPVVYVSYEDARRYSRWAGVDLPTEAEWLYACRAGASTAFYWGDLVDDRYVWHRANTGGMGTRPVARKWPNAWGLYDMVGNAWEYCKVGPNDVSFSLRGGSWTRCPRYRTRQGPVVDDLLQQTVALCLQRYEPNPSYSPPLWDDDRGFRCIRRTSTGAE